MRLRKAIEKRLPLHEHEEYLSDKAASMVFRGSYFLPQEIIRVESWRNIYRKTRDAYPHRLAITRRYEDGTVHITGSGYEAPVYSVDTKDVENEMRNRNKLARANRVERTARRIKATALGVGVAGLIGFGIAIAMQSDEKPSAETHTESCESVATGGEVLLPLREDTAERLVSLGAEVCSLADNQYLLIEQGEK